MTIVMSRNSKVEALGHTGARSTQQLTRPTDTNALHRGSVVCGYICTTTTGPLVLVTEFELSIAGFVCTHQDRDAVPNQGPNLKLTNVQELGLAVDSSSNLCV
jgi:hypothetical protein